MFKFFTKLIWVFFVVFPYAVFAVSGNSMTLEVKVYESSRVVSILESDSASTVRRLVYSTTVTGVVDRATSGVIGNSNSTVVFNVMPVGQADGSITMFIDADINAQYCQEQFNVKNSYLLSKDNGFKYQVQCQNGNDKSLIFTINAK